MTLHDFGFLGNEPNPHGTRANYRSGCHCLPCRVANASYEAARARSARLGTVHTVDASASRAHLLTLQRKGVGYRHAARLAGIGARTAKQIRTGDRQRITPEVEAAILGARASLAHGSHVNGYEARRKLRTLLSEGFTVDTLASVLHLRRETIERDTTVIPDEQQGIYVPRKRVSTVLRVRAFFGRVMAEGPDSTQAEN